MAQDYRTTLRYREPSYALVYAGIMPLLVEEARNLGYALAVHGSMATDLDLLACPWIEDAAEPQALIDAICKRMQTIYDLGPGPYPEVRPHGRETWSLHFRSDNVNCVGGPYLDISIMPPARGVKCSTPHPQLRWIGQVDAMGCGAACIAMLTGKTYDEVKADFEDHDFTQHGINSRVMENYLINKGFALAHKYVATAEREGLQWPPTPWAKVHLCYVKREETSPSDHWVLMMRDGTILDPLTSNPKNLTDYWRVFNVAAVVHVN